MKIKCFPFLQCGLILAACGGRFEWWLVHHCEASMQNQTVKRFQISGSVVVCRERSYLPTAACVGGWVRGCFQHKMKQGQILKSLPKIDPKALFSISPKHCHTFTHNNFHLHQFLTWYAAFALTQRACTVIQKLHLLLLKIEVRLKMFWNPDILNRGPNRD